MYNRSKRVILHAKEKQCGKCCFFVFISKESGWWNGLLYIYTHTLQETCSVNKNMRGSGVWKWWFWHDRELEGRIVRRRWIGGAIEPGLVPNSRRARWILKEIQQAISNGLNETGMVRKEGNWVANDLRSRNGEAVSSCLNNCYEYQNGKFFRRILKRHIKWILYKKNKTPKITGKARPWTTSKAEPNIRGKSCISGLGWCDLLWDTLTRRNYPSVICRKWCNWF